MTSARNYNSPPFSKASRDCSAAPFRPWEVLQGVKTGGGDLYPHAGLGKADNRPFEEKARSCCHCCMRETPSEKQKESPRLGAGTASEEKTLQTRRRPGAPGPSVAEFCPATGLLLSAPKVSQENPAQPLKLEKILADGFLESFIGR